MQATFRAEVRRGHSTQAFQSLGFRVVFFWSPLFPPAYRSEGAYHAGAKFLTSSLRLENKPSTPISGDTYDHLQTQEKGKRPHQHSFSRSPSGATADTEAEAVHIDQKPQETTNRHRRRTSPGGLRCTELVIGFLQTACHRGHNILRSRLQLF